MKTQDAHNPAKLRLLLPACLAMACSGSLAGGQDAADENDDDEMTGDEGPRGGAGGMKPIDDVLDDDDVCREAPRALSSPALVRLTAAQIRNALFDIFPDMGLEALDLHITETQTRDEFSFSNRSELLEPTAIFMRDLTDALDRSVSRLFRDRQSASKVLGGFPAARSSARADVERALLRYAPRVLRRPLQDDEKARLLALFDQAFIDTGAFEDDTIVAAAPAFAGLLHMPEFVLRFEPGERLADGRFRLGGRALAARMAFALWDAPPDDALLEAADRGALDTPEGRAEEARRLLADHARSSRGLVSFFSQWLDWERVSFEAKDADAYPQFTPELVASMREQARRFVLGKVQDGPGTMAALLSDGHVPIDARLAALFAVEPPASGEWETRDLSGAHRHGFLTLPIFLSGYAHPQNGSPTLRGLFILDRLLCTPPPDPPANVDTSITTSTPNATNRQIYEQHLANAACAGCHRFFDGMGFSLENYDTIGQYREEDQGQPIDARGDLLVDSDEDGPIDGARDLATRLSRMPMQRACTARRAFEFALGEGYDEARVSDACLVHALSKRFDESGGRIDDLFLSLFTSESFAHRSPL